MKRKLLFVLAFTLSYVLAHPLEKRDVNSIGEDAKLQGVDGAEETEHSFMESPTSAIQENVVGAKTIPFVNHHRLQKRTNDELVPSVSQSIAHSEKELKYKNPRLYSKLNNAFLAEFYPSAEPNSVIPRGSLPNPTEEEVKAGLGIYFLPGHGKGTCTVNLKDSEHARSRRMLLLNALQSYIITHQDAKQYVGFEKYFESWSERFDEACRIGGPYANQLVGHASKVMKDLEQSLLKFSYTDKTDVRRAECAQAIVDHAKKQLESGNENEVTSWGGYCTGLDYPQNHSTVARSLNAIAIIEERAKTIQGGHHLVRTMRAKRRLVLLDALQFFITNYRKSEKVSFRDYANPWSIRFDFACARDKSVEELVGRFEQCIQKIEWNRELRSVYKSPSKLDLRKLEQAQKLVNHFRKFCDACGDVARVAEWDAMSKDLSPKADLETYLSATANDADFDLVASDYANHMVHFEEIQEKARFEECKEKAKDVKLWQLCLFDLEAGLVDADEAYEFENTVESGFKKYDQKKSLIDNLKANLRDAETNLAEEFPEVNVQELLNSGELGDVLKESKERTTREIQVRSETRIQKSSERKIQKEREIQKYEGEDWSSKIKNGRPSGGPPTFRHDGRRD